MLAMKHRGKPGKMSPGAKAFACRRPAAFLDSLAQKSTGVELFRKRGRKRGIVQTRVISSPSLLPDKGRGGSAGTGKQFSLTSEC